MGWFLPRLHEHPDLVLVLAGESAGWLAWALPFIDWNYDGCRLPLLPLGRPKLDAMPSQYVRRQVKATFAFDPSAVEGRGITGVDSLLWGSGHTIGGVATPRDTKAVESQFGDAAADEVARMTRGNAAAVFGLRP